MNYSAEIAGVMQQLSRLYKEIAARKKNGERSWDLEQKRRELERREDELGAQAAKAFANLNGWRVSRRFQVETLIKGARKYFVAWGRQLIKESRAFDVPFFLKQLGALAFDGERRIRTKHPAGADPDEWPADLRVQQWPRVHENEERSVSQPTFL